ncbi:MAG: 2-succinyl-5-enolpyruvyl-6-hydroxy-3-cyclohexene-1-carboxylic-acid synthase [Eggerthellaceae bacterium]|nr:2-succinyl-5-enolpyruvyl-6-hydroxy-3-cyclohexene-1-carboxylic-acid synthase [Eggerthellaceae bacterium]
MSVPQKTALFVSAFFDELVRWGVREVVVSPGSRSTALAMVAYEMSRRWPEKLRLYMDIDERGAGFLALGMAKASGRPVALVCTSGTAPANYYPAVVEADTSRVPLIVLSGDRPLHAQGLGAVQTCDQVKLFGDYVRRFQQMPPAQADDRSIAYARQMAREMCIAAQGPAAGMPSQGTNMAQEGVVASRGCAHYAGPVHLNFPLEEPLKPDLTLENLFVCGRSAALGSDTDAFRTRFEARPNLSEHDARDVLSLLRGRRTLVLVGEGSCETADEAQEILAWARRWNLPLLADPLSGLRCFDDRMVIDNYDSVFRQKDCPLPQVVVRFGRYPVSKPCFTRLGAAHPLNVVVDAAETRDFNAATDAFVPCTPLSFVRSCTGAVQNLEDAVQERFFKEWAERNDAARERIMAVVDDEAEPEGAFVRKLMDLIPENSCLFSANSMSIRALDTFHVKQCKRLAVLCNRGQNGIDGTVSTALGAAQMYGQTTFLTGDFTMLHDLNALALQREMLLHHGGSDGSQAASMVIVLLNNNGGAIFDMLPQKSDESYFERLFLVPQDVDFQAAACAFSVPYRCATSVAAFEEAYGDLLGTPGIALLEVKLPLKGVTERYAPYQR